MISETNPIRLIDLNKYPLSEKNIHDKDLIKWTKELIHTFTSNSDFPYNLFKNTVEKNVYNAPLNVKFSKYGARHFVMKKQCALNDKEIDALRKEATSIYSPYWYGMISTCHHSGHITLRIAELLFPSVTWHIIKTRCHTFVTNISYIDILSVFSDVSPFSCQVNMENTNNKLNHNEKITKVNKLLEKVIVDKAEFDESSPMIIDLLATNKDTFLGLVGRCMFQYTTIHNNARKYRDLFISSGNIIPSYNNGNKSNNGGNGINCDNTTSANNVRSQVNQVSQNKCLGGKCAIMGGSRKCKTRRRKLCNRKTRQRS